MKNGATDFLENPFNDQTLIDLVRRFVELSMIDIQQSTHKKRAQQLLSLLTGREHEVLRELVAGKPSKKIASLFGVSTKTVDVHRSNIMRKTGAGSTAEMIRIYLDAETVKPGE